MTKPDCYGCGKTECAYCNAADLNYPAIAHNERRRDGGYTLRGRVQIDGKEHKWAAVYTTNEETGVSVDYIYIDCRIDFPNLGKRQDAARIRASVRNAYLRMSKDTEDCSILDRKAKRLEMRRA